MRVRKPSAKRKIVQLAAQRNTTPFDLLKESYERLGNQHLVAKELGVSQGTISREMLLQGLIDNGGYIPSRSQS